MHALIILRGPLAAILDGRKRWELRGSRTTRRGTIGLIEKGSGLVVGCAELVDAIGPLDPSTLMAHAADLDLSPSAAAGAARYYARPHAWVLEGARRLSRPVPYTHPRGAVIWVRLAEEVARSIGG